MADSIFAAASKTGVGSSERIASEFQAQGHPTNTTNVSEGSVLGGFEILTPKVGDGFVDWAISGYSLNGRAPAATTETDYHRKGDWRFDKVAINPHDSTTKEDLRRANYIPEGN